MTYCPAPPRAAAPPDPLRIALLLPPGFGLPAFASLHDLCHLLNRAASDGPRVRCDTVVLDGILATSSSGRVVRADRTLRDAGTYDLVVVLGALSGFSDSRAEAWLRRQQRHGATLGAVTSGLWLLAHGGLVGGRRCTLHWADLEAFRERYPEADVTADLYVIAPGLITCAGLGAVPDMMFAYLNGRIEQPLLTAVMQQLVLERLRDPTDPQRLPASRRLAATDPLVAAAAARIEAAAGDRAVVGTLGPRLGVTNRWLQMAFRRATGMTMKDYQLSCRLERAGQLLLATGLPVAQVAAMTGFADGSHLSAAFRRWSGQRPGEFRRRTAA